MEQTQQRSEKKQPQKQLDKSKYSSSLINSEKKSMSFIVPKSSQINTSFSKKYQVKRKDPVDDWEVVSTKAHSKLQNRIDKLKYIPGSKSARWSPVAFTYSNSTSSLNKFLSKNQNKQEEVKESKKDDFFNRLTQSVTPMLEKFTCEKQQAFETRRYKKYISKSFSKLHEDKLLKMYNREMINYSVCYFLEFTDYFSINREIQFIFIQCCIINVIFK